MYQVPESSNLVAGLREENFGELNLQLPLGQYSILCCPFLPGADGGNLCH